jgi:hypothetical protein
MLDLFLNSTPTSLWDPVGPLLYHYSWRCFDVVLEHMGASGHRGEHIRELTDQVLELSLLRRGKFRIHVDGDRVYCC